MKKRTRKPVTPPSLVRSMLRRLFMWSRERAETLKRDGRKCRACGSREKLNVHHVNGIRWDRIMAVIYEELLCPADKLLTLCGPCHAAQEPHETLKIDKEVASQPQGCVKTSRSSGTR